MKIPNTDYTITSAYNSLHNNVIVYVYRGANMLVHSSISFQQPWYITEPAFTDDEVEYIFTLLRRAVESIGYEDLDRAKNYASDFNFRLAIEMSLIHESDRMNNLRAPE